MKVTAFNKYTGEKIYEIELKECGIAAAAHSGYRPFDIGDYVVYQRNGECQLGRVASFDNYDREKIFVCFNKGCTASAANIADLFPATVTEQTRAVQEGRLFGYHRFDVSCPDYTPERCYIFCPQFDDQEVR